MAFIPRVIDKFLDFANLARHNSNFSDIKTELDGHDAKFNASTGHKHTGAAGDAPKLDSASLANGAATDTIIGNRTIDDTVAAAAGADTPTRLWSKLANIIKQLNGEAAWWTAPVITIRAIYNKFQASGGHTHDGVNGNGPQIDHANLTNKGTNTHAQIDAHLIAGTAHNSTSAATAGAIMQRDSSARAKVAAPAAADDIARKDTVDAVQENLDTHTGNASIHTTTADKTKLAGIAAGAEVNQNAFAKIAVPGQSDVTSSAKSDTVTFKNGTGITVTTNPTSKEVTITATGEALPGAHASSHITGGTDVIPNAVAGGSSGLMSGSDKTAVDASITHVAATTGIHGATSAATASRLAQRDIDGRMKVAAPATTDDVARKDTVDNALVMGMQRQAIINGGFTIAQRGATFTAPAGTASFVRYTFDRWFELEDPNGGNLPNITSKTEQNGTDGNYLRLTFSGSGSSFGAGAQASFVQPIENGTRFLCGLGKKITVSFEARSSLSGKKISCWAQQTYGTGGTPNSAEPINGKVMTLSSTFQKFIYTFDTNTLVGKVFGTNNDDTFNIRIGYMWGSGLASLNGDTVAETYRGAGNLDIRNVQVNAGDTALPFQPRSYGEELALCQRYYETSYNSGITPGTASYSGIVLGRSRDVIAANTAGTVFFGKITFATRKRVNPTMTLYATLTGAANSVRVNVTSERAGCTVPDVNQTGFYGIACNNSSAVAIGLDSSIDFHFTADAEL